MSTYHFTGIGGVGMSAIAELALLSGLDVSGSDRHLDADGETRVLEALRKQGAALFPQDGSGIASDTRFIVASTAIEEGNSDLQAASDHGVMRLHRSEMLARLIEGSGRRVAVSGTCGKSTVTGLIGWLLSETGKDPSVINGAPLADWMSPASVGSARVGQGGVVVFEADESDRSLRNYQCELAVITNASADHFDLEETNKLFDDFAAGAEEVVDARTAGFYDSVRQMDGGFEYGEVEFVVPMPGEHNIQNAFVAVRVCELLGCELVDLSAAIERFKGVSRRLEHVGEARGISVYDDYAHNTEKIRAALQTLQEKHTAVACIWRPHGYGPLRAMLDDLVSMFATTLRATDRLVLLPVYDAGGTADRSVNSDLLANMLKASNAYVVLAEDACLAKDIVLAELIPGSAVVTLGARDPGLPVLAADIMSAISV